MLSSKVVVIITGAYLGGLFLLAYISEIRARRGSARFVSSSLVYTLSLAVYCTSWTFYGAVGSAARNGLEYLTIYIGPTLVLIGWSFLLRKLVRVSKKQHITSIADFLSARYGKSASLSALVTIIALIGITPYIALQLKAVVASFNALGAAQGWEQFDPSNQGIFSDTGFWVALCMATFVILFGTRNLGADERHPGVVAAIAFESIVKLISLGAVGLFALYGLHNGLGDLYAKNDVGPDLKSLYGFSEGFEPRWMALTFLSATAFICLPRQFQVAVVENSDEKHLATASWLFPLYMLLISLFVIPIAISGLKLLPESTNPDLFVLHLPLAFGQQELALLAFIGGLSAATSMVIVASIALAIMISNHLVTPILLRLPFFTGHNSGNFFETLLVVRRMSIVAILTLGFAYYRLTGTTSPLASIGLISFAGIAQFLPALVGAIYWRGATRAGATVGLIGGFCVWAYTLLVPSFAHSGWAFVDLYAHGPWGVGSLKPDALFGLEGWDPLVHGLFWSMSSNVLLFVVISLATSQSPLERLQSTVFVDVFERSAQGVENALQRSATTDDLLHLASRVLGPERANRIFRDYARSQGETDNLPAPGPALIAHVERQLASSVGAASARSLVSRIVTGETISLDAVISILDETKEVIRYSRELERKSRELEETAEKLRRANAQLTRMDKRKDDFLSRVSHELRTPMTSIRSFSKILVSQDDLEPDQVSRFLHIIQQESERLTRLLDEILDLGRMESGQADWFLEEADASNIVLDAVETMRGLAQEHGVRVEYALTDRHMPVTVDPDRLKQVFINLLSNAIKFNESADPVIHVEALPHVVGGMWEIRIRDNGPGILPADQVNLFTKFSRSWNDRSKHRRGSGLGLAISRQIMRQLGGNLSLVHSDSNGSCFAVSIPVRQTSTKKGRADTVA